MPFRKSKATKAKVAVTDQVSDRTDDLVAALDAAKEALARASAVASREAGKAADKLMPERARQRRREAARRRNRRLLAGAAGLGGLLLVLSRVGGGKGDELRQDMARQAGTPADDAPRWDRPAEPGPGASAEVTQLHGNGAGGDPARTPPS
jgi:ferric-dicitrate binding protein FerR (iron transport regulator)